MRKQLALSLWLLLAFGGVLMAHRYGPTERGFPFILPREKPDRPLSEALERLYTAYPAPRPEDNELYTQFRYTKLNGFDYNNHDGTISRREPVKNHFCER